MRSGGYQSGCLFETEFLIICCFNPNFRTFPLGVSRNSA